MTSYEKRLAAQLLNKAADEFANHGCNDFPLDNNEVTRALYIAHLHGDCETPETEGTSLCFEDWLLMRHLADKLMTEVLTEEGE